MAYNGYLIKVKGISGSESYSSDYTIPLNFVLEKTYKMTYSVIDFDSTRNGAGKLVRNALSHKVPHCSIQVRPLDNTQLATMLSAIRNRYTIRKEKKVVLSVFVPEINQYVETSFYLPDLELTIRRIENNQKVIYEGFTLEFIGY